jgi:hypothetical protein
LCGVGFTAAWTNSPKNERNSCVARREISVGYKLSDFPDGFYIINDLKTESGNLDHVVIGPTGVFALDTKSWRGVVSADGKGELWLMVDSKRPM